MKNSIPLGFIRIFILLICLTSCGSKKQQKVALPADFKGPKELARLYGVRITPEDNIFLYNEGARWLGVRHKLGGSTKRGVDCSGSWRETWRSESRGDLLEKWTLHPYQYF